MYRDYMSDGICICRGPGPYKSNEPGSSYDKSFHKDMLSRTLSKNWNVITFKDGRYHLFVPYGITVFTYPSKDEYIYKDTFDTLNEAINA